MIRPTPAVGMALVVSTGRREYNENSGKLVSAMPGRTNPHNPFSMVYRSDGSDKDGSMVGSITSKYAKKLEEEMLWELRNEVVVINAEGKKLETDLMYWDMKKEIVYSDRYSRLSSGDQIIEGNKGFKSDQSLKNPVFNKITGVVEIENRP